MHLAEIVAVAKAGFLSVSNCTESSLSDLPETALMMLIFNAVARLVLDAGASQNQDDATLSWLTPNPRRRHAFRSC